MLSRMALKLPGFTYENTVPEKDILVAMDWLTSEKTMSSINEESPESNWRYLGNFALVKRGKVTMQDINWACHANLTYTDAERSCVAFWCHAHFHGDWKPFIHWLATDSFCSEYVLAVEDTGFVVSADIPAGVLHAIAMTSRVPRMFSQEYFQRWNRLVREGIHPGVAYQAVFNIAKGPVTGIFGFSTDHRTFPCPTKEGMKVFLNGRWAVPKRRLALFSSGESDSYCSQFLEGVKYRAGTMYQYATFVDDLFEDEKFLQILSLHRQGTTEKAYSPPNPFKKAAPEMPAGCMTINEVYEIALPYCMKEGIFNDT